MFKENSPRTHSSFDVWHGGKQTLNTLDPVSHSAFTSSSSIEHAELTAGPSTIIGYTILGLIFLRDPLHLCTIHMKNIFAYEEEAKTCCSSCVGHLRV